MDREAAHGTLSMWVLVRMQSVAPTKKAGTVGKGLNGHGLEMVSRTLLIF